MKKMTFIITFALVFIMVIPASATSLQGMKGLIKTPIADTPAEGKYGLNFQVIGGDESTLSFNYGIWENFEIFVSLDNQNNFAESEVHGGVKARVVREMQIQPSIALGLRNRDLFVVASKTIDYKSNLRGHLGFGTGAFDGLYFGLNKTFNPVTISSSGSSALIPVTNCKLEFLQNEINLGADFLFNEHFVLNLGVINFGEFTYGIGYSSAF